MERKYNSINCYFYYNTIPSTHEVNVKHTDDQWNSNIDEIIEKLKAAKVIPKPPEPKFKVGDVVCYLDNYYRKYTIKKIDFDETNRYRYTYTDDGWDYESNLVLYKTIPEPKFKVGDLVFDKLSTIYKTPAIIDHIRRESNDNFMYHYGNRWVHENNLELYEKLKQKSDMESKLPEPKFKIGDRVILKCIKNKYNDNYPYDTITCIKDGLIGWSRLIGLNNGAPQYYTRSLELYKEPEPKFKIGDEVVVSNITIHNNKIYKVNSIHNFNKKYFYILMDNFNNPIDLCIEGHLKLYIKQKPKFKVGDSIYLKKQPDYKNGKLIIKSIDNNYSSIDQYKYNFSSGGYNFESEIDLITKLYKIGDKVKVINRLDYGTIVGIGNNNVNIKFSNNFVCPYLVSDIEKKIS